MPYKLQVWELLYNSIFNKLCPIRPTRSVSSTFLFALAVMEIKRCSPVKASSWLLIGSWSEVTVTSQFLCLPGERSSRDLMLPSQVMTAVAFSDILKSQ